jgi:hypothetical protein
MDTEAVIEIIRSYLSPTEDMRACGTIELVAAYESVLEVNVSAQILELAQASRSSKTL